VFFGFLLLSFIIIFYVFATYKRQQMMLERQRKLMDVFLCVFNGLCVVLKMSPPKTPCFTLSPTRVNLVVTLDCISGRKLMNGRMGNTLC